MNVVSTLEQVREQIAAWRRQTLTIGFVPTMGYLHEGHLSLVDEAARQADRIVVSIYVNPTQFDPTEDLDVYPRDFDRDERLCRERGVALLFYPSNETMYTPDHSTWVQEESLTGALCGQSRPTHFRGVTTVVAKLFHIVQPDVAVFGRKDAQQALVIQRMVRDLNIPVSICTVPIVREPDGLAMSSRNRYLTGDQRQRALCLNRSLREAVGLHAQGERSAKCLVNIIREAVRQAEGNLDYVELVSRETLHPLEMVNEPALLAVAAHFGPTRLLDNADLG
ncbi:MAG: pantoate--beta-alanine ligase [Lentisphaeria bacterium]|nr:pantoate--beta-alanine ligase [Lentisphaeria bacterium]